MTSLLAFHINLHRSPQPSYFLCKSIASLDNVVVCVNEPVFYEKTGKISKLDIFDKIYYSTLPDTRCRAAIGIKGKKLNAILLSQYSSPDLVVLDLNFNGTRFIIISAYLPPNEHFDESLAFLDDVIQKIKIKNLPILICSDTNARSNMWNDNLTNERGKQFEDFVINNELIIFNDEDVHTYDCSTGTSTIDLILGNAKMLDLSPSVLVDQDYESYSDHKRLNIELNFSSENSRFCEILTENKFFSKTFAGKTSTRKFVIKDNLWPKFDENLEDFKYILNETNFSVACEEEADFAVSKLNEFLNKTCYNTFPLIRYKNKKPKETNEEIEKLENLIKNRQKRVTRLKESKSFQYEDALNELKEIKRLHKLELYKHAKNYWRNVCTTNDINKAYKLNSMCKGKLFNKTLSTIKKDNGEFTNSQKETIEHIMNHFFPDNLHPKLGDYLPSLPPEEILFTQEEIKFLLNVINNNKAPGPDGFTGSILKRAVNYLIGPLTNLFNSLIKLNYFPKFWKLGFVVLIPKSGNNSGINSIKNYRPITLLSLIAKTYEKLLTNILNKHLYLNKKMDSRQVGFCKQLSTEDGLIKIKDHIHKELKKGKSVIMVLLDITGAFDNAPWCRIIEILENKNVPKYLINCFKSYFKNREICLSTGDTVISKKTTQGCPQGSCSGPSLWNILLDDLFAKLNNEGFNNSNEHNLFVQAYADDTSTCFSYFENESSIENVERYIDEVLRCIYLWGVENGLKFNVSKTQAIRISLKNNYKLPEINFYNQKVQLSNEAKYLGVWFDSEFSFKPHIEKAIAKAKKAYSITRCYTANTWGIDAELSRLIYKSVILPTLTYGCSVWFNALDYKKIQNSLRSFQYLICKSIIKAYKTISIVNSIILSDVLPLSYHIFATALISLTRIYGAINPVVFEQDLFIDHKPNFRSIRSEDFRNQTSTRFFVDNKMDKIKNLLNNNALNYFNLEPKIHWTHIPTGCEKIIPGVLEEIPLDYDYYIFTDGSKINNIGVGASYTIFYKDRKLVTNLITYNPKCNVHQSEQFAIYCALEKLLDGNYQLKNKKVVICTDSLSSIQGINKVYSDKFIVYIINKSLIKYKNRDAEVKFCKIKGHSGIIGNELADKLAKKAAFKSMECDKYDYNFISLNHIKSLLFNRCFLNWTNSVFDPNSDSDRAQLKKWTQNFMIKKDTFKNSEFTKLTDFDTTKILTGHGPFNDYLVRFKLTNDLDICPDCLISNDGPEHILFHCNGYKEIHSQLASIGIKDPVDLKKVFENEHNINLFKMICKSISDKRSNSFENF